MPASERVIGLSCRSYEYPRDFHPPVANPTVSRRSAIFSPRQRRVWVFRRPALPSSGLSNRVARKPGRAGGPLRALALAGQPLLEPRRARDRPAVAGVDVARGAARRARQLAWQGGGGDNAGVAAGAGDLEHHGVITERRSRREAAEAAPVAPADRSHQDQAYTARTNGATSRPCARAGRQCR
jgi:hypothetical protein